MDATVYNPVSFASKFPEFRRVAEVTAFAATKISLFSNYVDLPWSVGSILRLRKTSPVGRYTHRDSGSLIIGLGDSPHHVDKKRRIITYVL